MYSTVVPSTTQAQDVKAPIQSGEGAALGSPLTITGTAEYGSLPVPFVASDPRLNSWFNLTGNLINSISKEIIGKQFEYIDASKNLNSAVEGVKIANIEAVRFAIRYGVTSEVSLMELGVLIDMVSGTTPPQIAIRDIESLNLLESHSDALIYSAERQVILALEKVASIKEEINRLDGELTSARTFAAHLVKVDSLINGTEIPSTSIDALLFTVSAPELRHPSIMPWENTTLKNIDNSLSKRLENWLIKSSKINEQLSGKITPDVGTVDLVIRVPSPKLKEVEQQLEGRSYTKYPTATKIINTIAVQAIGVSNDNAKTLGLASPPISNFAIASTATRVVQSLRLGAELIISSSSVNLPLGRSGVSKPIEVDENQKIIFAKKNVKSKIDKNSNYENRNNEHNFDQSTLVIAGFAPLIPGAGLALPEESLQNPEEYLIALDHSNDKDATRLTWALMMQYPQGSIIQSSAAPQPTAFYTADEAATILGTMKYDSVDWRANSRSIEIVDGYLERNIGVRRYPVLGSFACNLAISSQLAGALAESVLRGLEEEINPAKFGGCYNPRLIRVGSGPSYHAWGLAVDLNVNENLMYTPGTMHDGVIAVFKAWGFRWGGDWSSVDPMHFETAALLRP